VWFAKTPLSQFNPATLPRAPQLGQHSAGILGGIGVDAERLAELRRAAIVETAGNRTVKHTTLELSSHAST
jgi:hypothetical protein